MLRHEHDAHYSLTELGELMLELAQAEDLDLDTALDRAAEELDRLHSYVSDWDRCAANAGNWVARSGAIPF